MEAIMAKMLKSLVRSPFAMMIVLGLVCGSLSGCVIEPAHPHYYHYGYWYR
jgi:hypothetical protein